MMHLQLSDRRTTGIALALATATISGFSIFVNASAVKQLPDPAVFTTLKNGFAVVLLAVLALAAARFRRDAPTTLDRRALLGLVAVGIIGGGVPFLLFFTGLAQASAPSAAFIHKTLFVWVALLAVPILHERLGLIQIAALAVLLGGQLLVTPPNGVTWGSGETMIAAATLLWSVEVVIARRLLATIPSTVLAVARLGIGLVVLTAYLVLTGKVAVLGSLSAMHWAWVALTGALLAGYVATWLAALRRAPATTVTSVLVLGAPITAVLHALSGGAVPALPAAFGHLLILVAVLVTAALGARRLETREPRSWQSITA